MGPTMPSKKINAGGVMLQGDLFLARNEKFKTRSFVTLESARQYVLVFQMEG